MTKLVPFDKYEAVLLLDGLLETIASDRPRLQIVMKISNNLRQMALNRGETIDDVYRNANGISFQLSSMESAYMGRTIRKPATRLFKEVVALYREKPAEYENLLREAKQMVGKQVESSSQSSALLEKKVKNILQKECESNRYGTTVDYLCTLIPGTRAPEVKRILDKAIWARIELGRYYYVELSDVSGDSETEVHNQTANVQVVNFEHIPQLAYTKPVKIKYFDDLVMFKSTWTDAYVQLFSALYDDYSGVIPMGVSFSGTGRVDFGDHTAAQIMIDSKPVGNTGMFLETNLSATDIAYKVKALLDICNVDYENVVIEFEHKQLKAKTGTPFLQEPSPILEKPSEKEVSKSELAAYEMVLEQFFKKGYRLGSALDIKKFRRYYEELNGKSANQDDAALEARIEACGIIHEGKVFLPKVMLKEDVAAKLLAYIHKAFAEGKPAIYYEALFDEFSEDFLDSYIYNADMLREYLRFALNSEFEISVSHISPAGGSRISAQDEVRHCLKEAGVPISVDELCRTLSHIPRDTILTLLATNLEFVRNSRERSEYFHADSLDLSSKELADIIGLISENIQAHHYISGTELMAAVQAKFPSLYESYSVYSDIGWRDALKYKLDGRFSFKGNIISAAGKTLSMADVFADFAASRDQFTVDELLKFSEELGSGVIYFDSVYENAIRVSENLFVSKNHAAFQVDETDAILDRFCPGSYITLADIQDFAIFPDAGFPWNSYLLESYVASFSDRYMLIHRTYGRSSAIGAIVKKSAGFYDFDSLIIDVLAVSGTDLTRENAIDWLFKKGYIGAHSFKSIEELLIQARAKRNRRK